MIGFLSVFPPFRGGISRFSTHVFQEIKKHEEAVAINYTRQYPPFLFPGQTQFLAQSDEDEYEFRRFLHAYNPFNWLKNPGKFFNEEVDHFIYSHWHPFFIPSTLSLIRRLKKKNPEMTVSGIVHNVLPHEKFPFQEALTERLFKNSNRIFTLSSQGTTELQKFSNQSRKGIQLFHPIYEHEKVNESKRDLRERWNIPENAFVLLFFGLVREYKGLSILIEAFNHFAEIREDIHVLVAGEFYESQEAYEEQIRPEFMQRFHIRNEFVSDKAMTEIMNLSDVLILPYKRATQSGVLADAISYQLPAITTNEPGFTDFLTDGLNGIVMKTHQWEELSDIILNLNQKKIDDLQKNLSVLNDKFSWKRFGKEILQDIHEIKLT